MTITTANLATTFAIMTPGLGVATKDFSPTFYAEIGREFNGFSGHVLVAMHTFSDDWNMWEIHPCGDEIVVLLSGAATMTVRTPAGDESRLLDRPGSFIVIPKGCWHTAYVAEGAAMLFITPGEATDNQLSPVSAE